MSLTLLQIVATIVVATILILVGLILLKKKKWRKSWEARLVNISFDSPLQEKKKLAGNAATWGTCAVGEIFKEVRQGLSKLDEYHIPQKRDIVKFLTPKYGTLTPTIVAELGVEFSDAIASMENAHNEKLFSSYRSKALDIYYKLQLIHESDDYD